MEEILEGVTVFVIFLGMSSPVLIIGLVYYFLKRLEHKQILAAIEKGTSLSELRPPKQKQNGALWIKNLTFGIALIVIGLGWLYVGPPHGGMSTTIAFIILCGVGIASLIRGLLYRKYQVQNQPLTKSNAAENRNTTGVSTPETLKQTNE
jgi:hypothetical protein